MTPVAKVLLTLVTLFFGALMTAGGMLYSGTVDDVKENEKNIEVLEKAVHEIKTYQAVDQAQQQTQTEILRELRDELRRQNTDNQ